MPVLHTRAQLPGIGDSSEVLIEAEGDEGSVRVELEAPENAAALAITVTDSGADGHTRAPRDVSVDVYGPDGTIFPATSIRTEGGQLVLVVPEPLPGTWLLEMTYGPSGAAQVNASAVSKGWMDRLLRGGRWLSCKTCKALLRAFIAVLLVHLHALVTSGVTVAAMLHQLPQVLLESLRNTLALRDPGLSDLIVFLLEYVADPIERALHAICSWLGLCAPEGRRRRPTASDANLGLKLTSRFAGGRVQPEYR